MTWKRISVILYCIIILGGTSLACKTLLSKPEEGEGVSVLINADEGGSITSADERLTLEIPAGALDEDTEIGITVVSTADIPEQVIGIEGIGTVYKLEPSGLEFSKPIFVNFTLGTESLVSEDSMRGVFVSTMIIVNEDGDVQALDELEIRYLFDDELPLLSGEIDHFSWIVEIDGTLDVAIKEQQRRKELLERFISQVRVGYQLKNSPDSYEVQRITPTATGKAFVFGDRELLSSPEVVDRNHYIERNSLYICVEEVGLGTYGVNVVAEKAYRRNGQVVLREPVRVNVQGVVECWIPPTRTPFPTETLTPLPTHSPTLPPPPTRTGTPTMTFTPTATATATGTATPTATATPTFRVAMTYAHTQPGVESEVYLHVWGAPGTEVEAQLTGPHVISEPFQTGVIDETGMLTITWRIGLFGTYVSFGMVGEEDFQISITVQ